MPVAKAFIDARDALLERRTDFDAARRDFSWPRMEYFNWALDYFDFVAKGNSHPALLVVDDFSGNHTFTFSAISNRSSQLANFLADQGVVRGDRILIMLSNVAPLWEAMLASIKLGAVIVPATTMLEGDELRDRMERGNIKAVFTHASLTDKFSAISSAPVRIAVGDCVPQGWLDYELSRTSSAQFAASTPTRADELLLLYFTSGTTARPKLVAHTHASYPIGHLSTMYWLGVQPGDVHLNLSSPGWAKHAWSCFFAPWSAQAAVVAYNYSRFDARALLDHLVRCEVTTFCAPPTVWRFLIQQDLSNWRVAIREAVSAGEPLNPEVISRVRDAWGLTIRDGFGQTETTALVGNPPGQRVKPGSMGRPLPGCPVILLDDRSERADEGEICIDMQSNPCALLREYLDDPNLTAWAMRDGFYHTGDVASLDDDGFLTYIGRLDDVFKSSDYRISPFELESVLIEHPAVIEAAVVPSPDEMRLAVPKAFVVLAAGYESNSAVAESLLLHVRSRVSPFKRIRRIEFGSLPKTISGKIRRVDLRTVEKTRPAGFSRRPLEYWEEDFPSLNGGKGS
ncbi:MAG TPA: AMP-binding protein [Steroidobacteraceae bacterium]|jgi:acetyl-CoA synthetase|nr:AMP-binding protein [Steroidobacteraceae bacterium]